MTGFNSVEPWIWITVFAAFFQNLRSALQKQASKDLTVLGAAYVRFAFALPFAIIYLLVITKFNNNPLPENSLKFFTYCFLGGLCQIVFTVLLISLFTRRNFAVGTVYSKTEVIQVAIFGYLILGDKLNFLSSLAVCLCVLGVVALAVKDNKIKLSSFWSEARGESSLIGIACGAFLGVSVVFYRGAALSLNYEGQVYVSAGYTLTIALVIQTIFMGLLIFFREKPTLKNIFTHWKNSMAVGITAVMASICWFTAFTMQSAAIVRALGQIELIFTFIFSHFLFREKTTFLEMVGITLIMSAVIVLMLGA